MSTIKPKRAYNKKSDYWSKIKKSAASAAVTSLGLSESVTKPIETEDALPTEVSLAAKYNSGAPSGSRTTARRNAASSTSLSSDYSYLNELVMPWSESNGRISIKEIIELCEKAYAYISIYRNTVDMMEEFSASNVYLVGGNATSRAFVEAWLKKINIRSLTKQFFREFYRSGNVFMYKFNGRLQPDDFAGLKKQFFINKNSIPLRYVVIDPKSIESLSVASFSKINYVKVMSVHELRKLKLKQTPEDELIFNNLPAATKEAIMTDRFNTAGIDMVLEPERLYAVFYKKQDYEPFAIPFGFPVLKDIDRKEILKNIDQAISNTLQNACLLITAGEKKHEFGGGTNPKVIEALQSIFENESTSRVIVADYTVNAKFIIPEIGNIIDPKKYEILNEDIKNGLMSILQGGEKFSNQNIKIEVFLERLIEGRQIFIDEFLQNEINALCKNFGLKSTPTAKFENIELQDKSVVARIYTRLAELGILPPQLLFRALETGVLPEAEELEAAQKKYVEDREKGYFNPLTGGVPMIPAADSGESGNEPNTTTPGKPMASNDGRPPGASVAHRFSAKKMSKCASDISEFMSYAETQVKNKYSVSEISEQQKKLLSKMTEVVIASREVSDWKNSFETLLSKPEELLNFSSSSTAKAITEMQSKYGVDSLSGAILYNSKM